MTLEEFKTKFAALKAKGFIPTLRKGSTGVGYTFETELGIKEDNLALPDIPEHEIKAHRNSSNSMITLFTFNNKAWIMPPLDAIRKYGSTDANGRLGMYYTMSLTPNSAGLFLHVGETEITVQHTSGEKIAKWQLADLAKRFEEKFPALLFVSAHNEERDGKEYFHYYRVQLMQGTKSDLLSELFKTGQLLLDLRLHDKETSARNHGTAFRVFEKFLPNLFTSIQDI